MAKTLENGRSDGSMPFEASMDLITEGLPKNETERPTPGGKQVLWRAYWKGPDDQRRNRLVVAYQPLVREIVHRLAQRLPRTVDRGDLETAANVGLMSAITSYDPTRRVRFEAYAEMRIRGALLDELRHMDWLPRPFRSRLEQRKRALARLRSELDREPFDEETALAMGISLEEYELLFSIALPDAPGGSMPIRAGGEELASGIEIVPDTRGDQPGEGLTRAELLRLVAQRMTEQEYRIVYLKYWEDLSMREIGQVMDLSESRVFKIHQRLLERLQERLSGSSA